MKMRTTTNRKGYHELFIQKQELIDILNSMQAKVEAREEQPKEPEYEDDDTTQLVKVEPWGWPIPKNASMGFSTDSNGNQFVVFTYPETGIVINQMHEQYQQIMLKKV